MRGGEVVRVLRGGHPVPRQEEVLSGVPGAGGDGVAGREAGA